LVARRTVPVDTRTQGPLQADDIAGLEAHDNGNFRGSPAHFVIWWPVLGQTQLILRDFDTNRAKGTLLSPKLRESRFRALGLFSTHVFPAMS